MCSLPTQQGFSLDTENSGQFMKGKFDIQITAFWLCIRSYLSTYL